jgi:hypothetical protein
MKPGPDFDRQCDEAMRGLIRAGILVLVILGLSVMTVLEQTGQL